jgi:hypothetical protein
MNREPGEVADTLSWTVVEDSSVCCIQACTNPRAQSSSCHTHRSIRDASTSQSLQTSMQLNSCKSIANVHLDWDTRFGVGRIERTNSYSNTLARVTLVDAMSASLSSHMPQLILLVKGPLYFVSNGLTLERCRRLSDHFCLLLRSGPKPCLAALVLTLSP